MIARVSYSYQFSGIPEHHRHGADPYRSARLRRPGTFLPILAVTSVALFAFVALAIDLGMLTVARTECQNAADAAALAGARLLNNGDGVSDNNRAVAEATARNVVTQNDLMNGRFSEENVVSATAMAYAYNTTTRRFELRRELSPEGSSWSAMEVRIAVDRPTFFARLLGINNLNTGATAIAVHRPRDIALVLDFSTSMRFGSLTNWENGYGGSGDEVYGMLSPDPSYPRFAHYQRYDLYGIDNIPSNASKNPNTISQRMHPFCCRVPFTKNSGEISAQSNLTVETVGGPPVIFDFRFDPANLSDPTTPVVLSNVNPNNLWNAFHRWFQTTPTDNPDMSLSVVDRSNVFKYSNMRPPIVAESEVYRADYANQLSFIHREFNWSGYNAYDTTNTSGPVPAPPFFATQSDDPTTGIAYVGDRFPRKRGIVRTDTTTWDPTNTQGAAVNLAEYLGWTQNLFGGGTFPGTPPDRRSAANQWRPGFANPSSGNLYNSSWHDFRDATWERYGYSLDVEHYVQTRNSYIRSDGVALGRWDPRWDINLNAPANATGASLWNHIPPRDASGNPIWPTGNASLPLNQRPRLRPAQQDLRGFSMGPGYWGKTFFMWPPDPRTPVGRLGQSNYVAGDWRRRFFLTSDGLPLNPTTHNINNLLLRNSTGATLNGSGYQVNYDAILDWLRTGPQVLPPNLRAGRILYYSSIPVGITAETIYAENSTGLNQFRTATGNPSATMDDLRAYNTTASSRNRDRNFWRAYINYVLGITNPNYNLAGIERRGWPEGVNPTISSTLNGFTHGISGASPTTDPRPYCHYTDNPSRPRLHFWFGPLTMLDFITSRAPRRFWWPGTCREAQCWQLKAAVNSAIDDIRINHPNDYCGSAYYNTQLTTIRVPMGQNWVDLKNALFYPFNLLTAIRNGDTTTELWAHTNTNADNQNLPGGHVPNANGGTDPHVGLALGFNLLMNGRRGAAKILIHETDGAPNNVAGWRLVGTGVNTRYEVGGTTEQYPISGLPDPLAANGLNTTIPRPGISENTQPSVRMALGVIQRIVAPYSETGVSGLSLPNTPARVYNIGFGDLFEGYDGTNEWETRTTPSTVDGVTSPPSAPAGGVGVFFLRRASQVGNTLSPVGDQPLSRDFIITGRYQTRIERLRTSLERIMQSGVQVTLIE